MRCGLIAVALLAFALAGCGRRGTANAPAAPAELRRVVCASPAVAEIVFALGCGDRVVGVSEFTDWPPEAAARPTIGSAFAPNRERILALAPDGVLTQGQSVALETFARAQGIGFRTVPLDTLADLRAAIASFAEILGVPDRGRELLERMDADFAALPAREPVSVFIALGHAPGDFAGLMTAGPGTFLSEIAALAGGSNVFADVAVLWPKVSLESLVRRRPALVLDVQSVPADAARRAALVADWEKRGFRADQVRILDEAALLKPGPRAAQSAAIVARALDGK
ncbi:MAG TPA: helical backbone metal receptor [Kiritimatiellia bacterium]|nr:helical backbone metal receptor [Kiritimatiellia bacterium]